MHLNLYDYAEDEAEVYAALQRDSKRDSLQIRVMDALTLALLFYLGRNLPKGDLVALLMLGALILSRLNTFIDNSNRNFFMHTTDWMNARGERRSEAVAL